jgi:hypothetical protein
LHPRLLISFAARNRGLFETLFAVGLKAEHRGALDKAALPLELAFLPPASAACNGDVQQAETLVAAIIANALGCATLLFNGTFDGNAEATAERLAAASTLALVHGWEFALSNAAATKRKHKPARL